MDYAILAGIGNYEKDQLVTVLRAKDQTAYGNEKSRFLTSENGLFRSAPTWARTRDQKIMSLLL